MMGSSEWSGVSCQLASTILYRHTAWIVLDTFVGASHFVQYNLYLCWSCFRLEVLRSNPLFCVGFSTHCWNPILVYIFLCFNLTQLYRPKKHVETHDIQVKLVMAGIACFRFRLMSCRRFAATSLVFVHWIRKECMSRLFGKHRLRNSSVIDLAGLRH